MRQLLALLAATVMVVACSNASTVPSTHSTSTGDPALFARLIQDAVSFDYDPVDTPAALRDEADLVVVGVIESIVPGRTLPGGRANGHANLRVKVQTAIAGNVTVKGGDSVYVELPIGSSDGIKGLAAAMPSGRIVFFLDDRTSIRAVGGEVGRPDGASIFTPFVQGMIIEDGDGLVSGLVALDDMSPAWRSAGPFDRLVADLTGRG